MASGGITDDSDLSNCEFKLSDQGFDSHGSSGYVVEAASKSEGGHSHWHSSHSLCTRNRAPPISQSQRRGAILQASGSENSILVAGQDFGLFSGWLESKIAHRQVAPENGPSRPPQVSFGKDMKLPMFVVAKLKVKLLRAREAIKDRNERARSKRAIDPGSKAKVCWDAGTTLLLIYTLFEIPFRLAFVEASCAMDASNSFNLFVDLIFMTDIVISFNTGYIERIRGEELLRDDRAQIAKRYLGSWFVIDLVSSVPLDVLVCASLTDTSSESSLDIMRVFKIARFLKLARLVKFWRVINKWQAMSTSPAISNGVLLFKLIIGLFMCAHIMGCGWELVIQGQDCGIWADAMLAPDPENRYGCECLYSQYRAPELKGICEPLNWMNKYDSGLHDNAPASEKYMTCFYFVIVGLSTVGFGDITPANDVERLVSTIYTLIGAVVFALIIGSISDIAQRSNKFSESISANLHAVADMLEHRDVPDELTQRIMQQMKYASARSPHHYANEEVFKLLDNSGSLLPRHLRVQLMAHLMTNQCDSFLLTLPLFVQMDPELRAELLIMFRPVLLNKGEYLFHALDAGEDMYVLVKGSLETFNFVNQFGYMGNDKHIDQPGDFVGEVLVALVIFVAAVDGLRLCLWLMCAYGMYCSLCVLFRRIQPLSGITLQAIRAIQPLTSPPVRVCVLVHIVLVCVCVFAFACALQVVLLDNGPPFRLVSVKAKERFVPTSMRFRNNACITVFSNALVCITARSFCPIHPLATPERSCSSFASPTLTNWQACILTSKSP
jgi:hypothetical protein